MPRKSAKRSAAAKLGLKRRKAIQRKRRSEAAKRGWRKRKAKLNQGSAIVLIEGPHGRAALTKDWDGFLDHDRLAEAAKEMFPDAKEWLWAFRAQFITEEPDESRWISIPFWHQFEQQLQNSKDQVLGAIEGIMTQSLRVVVPLQLTVVVR